MTLRLFLLMIGAGLLATPTQAQSDSLSASDQATNVRGTIDALFDGMRAGDDSAVRSVFADGARLQTALGPGDTTSVRTTPVGRFADAVGQPRDEVWDERTWNVEVRVDGPLATAWVPYAFYLGDELSHCGVNAVQLVQQADGWKILQLTDTRRETCNVPEEVQK